MIDFDSINAVFAHFAFNANPSGRRRLYLKLAKLIGNGVQILAAIESIRDLRVELSGKSHPEAIALEDWAARIRNGKTLSGAAADWIPSDEAMLIAAGERAGTLENALRSVTRVMEARKQIRGAVIGGLAYPIALLLLAFAVLYLFGFKIVPAFNAVAKGARWHGTARMMVDVSLFARHWLWAVVLAVVAALTAIFASLPRLDGPVRVWLDRHPPYNVYRIIHGSTWLIALAALVEAGLKIETALEQLAYGATPWLTTRIRAAIGDMRMGHNLGQALSESGYQFPDREIIADLNIYARFSGFDTALANLGREWLDESVEHIKVRMSALFGIALVLVGSLVGFMLSGMFDLQSQMSDALQHAYR